jgi:hypothetical protein
MTIIPFLPLFPRYLLFDREYPLLTSLIFGWDAQKPQFDMKWSRLSENAPKAKCPNSRSEWSKLSLGYRTRLPLMHAFASAHAFFCELGTVNFCFEWRHRDGSTVEFNPNGWTSDDPVKSDWLSKMNRLYSSSPGVPPVIRKWLQEECYLIDARRSG